VCSVEELRIALGEEEKRYSSEQNDWIAVASERRL
jgi:hypothetical protein